MDIKIVTDFTDYESYLKLAPALIRAAGVTSLNRTIRSLRAKTRTDIRKKFNIKAGRLNKAMKILPASRFKLQAEIRIEGRPPSLMQYVPKIKGRNLGHRKGGPGVSVEIRRGQREIVEGAFVATIRGQAEFSRARGLKSSKLGIFKRTGFTRISYSGVHEGKNREEIEMLFGPDIPWMSERFKIHNAVIARGEELMAINFEREILRRAGRLGAI